MTNTVDADTKAMLRDILRRAIRTESRLIKLSAAMGVNVVTEYGTKEPSVQLPAKQVSTN